MTPAFVFIIPFVYLVAEVAGLYVNNTYETAVPVTYFCQAFSNVSASSLEASTLNLKMGSYTHWIVQLDPALYSRVTEAVCTSPGRPSIVTEVFGYYLVDGQFLWASEEVFPGASQCPEVSLLDGYPADCRNNTECDPVVSDYLDALNVYRSCLLLRQGFSYITHAMVTNEQSCSIEDTTISQDMDKLTFNGINFRSIASTCTWSFVSDCADKTAIVIDSPFPTMFATVTNVEKKVCKGTLSLCGAGGCSSVQERIRLTEFCPELAASGMFGVLDTMRWAYCQFYVVRTVVWITVSGLAIIFLWYFWKNLIKVWMACVLMLNTIGAKPAATGLLMYKIQETSARGGGLDDYSPDNPHYVPHLSCDVQEGILQNVDFVQSENSICTIIGSTEECDIKLSMNVNLDLSPGTCATWKVHSYAGGEFDPYYVDLCATSNFINYELEWKYEGCQGRKVYHDTKHACNSNLDFSSGCDRRFNAQFNHYETQSTSGCRLTNGGPCFNTNTASICCRAGVDCVIGSHANVYDLPAEPTSHSTGYSIRVRKGDLVTYQRCFTNQFDIIDDESSYPLSKATVAGVFRPLNLNFPATKKIVKPLDHPTNNYFVATVADRFPNNDFRLFGAFQYTGGDYTLKQNWAYGLSAIDCVNFRCNDNKAKSDMRYTSVAWNATSSDVQTIQQYFIGRGSISVAVGEVPTIAFESYETSTASIFLEFDLVNVTLFRRETCPVIDSIDASIQLSGDGVPSHGCAQITAEARCGKGVITLSGEGITPTTCIIDVTPTSCCFTVTDGSSEYTLIATGATTSTYKFTVEVETYASQLGTDLQSSSTKSSGIKGGFIKAFSMPGFKDNITSAILSFLMYAVLGILGVWLFIVMLGWSGKSLMAATLASRVTSGELRKNILRRSDKKLS